MKLALGTVQFGLPYGIANRSGQVSRSDAREMLRCASASGIDTLDTAISYGDSEACLGEAGVSEFRLVTKLPALPQGDIKVDAWVREQVTASLGRLGVRVLHAVLLHRPEQLLGGAGERLYAALAALKADGLARKVGVSIYAPDELESLTSRFRLDLVQAPLNLIDRRLLTSGWLARLHADGVEVHTRSAFLQGLLLLPPSERPAFFARWGALWRDWQRWLDECGCGALEACLAFPLACSGVDRVVVGADNPAQLDQLVRAARAAAPAQWPELTCNDEDLVNPSRWNQL